jgi:glycosyltransferase involved in cell wall biosynthesis
MMRGKAKVCVLTSAHKPTSTRVFYKQCRSLAQAGYDVTFVVPAGFDERVQEGVRVLGVPKPTSRLGRPKIWFRLLRTAVNLDPDIVHFHDPELLSLAPLLRLRLGQEVRIIYDVHEYFVDSIAHKVWIPRPLRKPVAWLAQNFERLLGRAVDGLVFVIEEQAPLYADWRAAHVVVHNYPQLETFADAVPLPAFPPDRFRLIYLGSLYARRGIMTMLEAMALVVPEAPEALLILGGAFESEAFREQVQTFIDEHHLGSHVTLLGWIDHADVKHYLASADVAWLPGLRVQQYQRRAISTKQLECMLMGLPIVSSDHPHRRIFIDEADCGFSVTADDPMAHAEAILRLYHHPEERRAMGARARQSVLDRYNWEREARTLLEFYDELCEL